MEKEALVNAALLSLNDLPWEPFGGKTIGIFRKPLSAAKFGSGFKAVLTLAKPGGVFPDHVDPYTHIFFILEGQGEAMVEGQSLPLKTGGALTVPAGRIHAYRNPGPADLLLITINIYEGVEGSP